LPHRAGGDCRRTPAGAPRIRVAPSTLRVREEPDADRHPVWDRRHPAGDRKEDAASSHRACLAARSRALEAAASSLPALLASEDSREEVLDRPAAVLRALHDRVADSLERLLEARADLSVADLAGAGLHLLGRDLDLRIVSRAGRQ